MLAGWARKPRPSASIACLDAVAQLVEGAGALLGAPLRSTSPASTRCGSVGFDAGLVAEQPEQGEVGVDLAVDHRLEVELDVRLAGEAGVVAQDAELQAVGRRSPTGGSSDRFRNSWTRPCGLCRAAPATPCVGRSSSTFRPRRWIGVFCQAWEIG